MLSIHARFAVTALVLALAAAVVSPADARRDVYAPTGETIDTTIVVQASRI
jgi:hypothetical protein